MKMETRTIYNITFSVKYFDGTEGGMEEGSFGQTMNTLPEAIELLRVARTNDPKNDWIIVCDVAVQVTGEQKS